MSHFQEGGKEKMDVTKVMNRGMELADLFVNKNYLIDIDKCEPIGRKDLFGTLLFSGGQDCL